MRRCLTEDETRSINNARQILELMDFPEEWSMPERLRFAEKIQGCVEVMAFIANHLGAGVRIGI